MNRPPAPNDLRTLPVAGRLQLVEDLWNSVGQGSGRVIEGEAIRLR